MGEDLVHGLVAACDGVIALRDEVGWNVETALSHGLEEGGVADSGGVIFGGAGDEADGGVSDGVEVVDGGLDAGGVVDDDAADLIAGACGVEEDEGDALLVEVFEDPGVHFGGHDGDAVDFSLEHALCALLGADGVVPGVGDEDFLSVAHGDIFKAPDELREEGIGDVGDDEAVEVAASGAEGAGVCVGVVVEFFNGSADARGGDVADFVGAIDGTRDGGGRNLRDPCYLFNVHAGSP